MATGFRNLIVYQKAFSLAMNIFELIKTYNTRSGEIRKLLNDMIKNPEKYS